MRIPVLVLGVAAVAGALSIPSPDAIAASSTFDGMKSLLEFRRDNTFEPPLDKTQAKQLKAVHKALEQIAKPTLYLDDDLKVAVAVVKGLEKAFPLEFNPPDALEGPGASFPPAVDALLDDFDSQVGDATSALALRAIGLSGKAFLKVGKALLAAEEALSGEFESRTDRARALLKAAKAIEKGNKAADKAAPAE